MMIVSFNILLYYVNGLKGFIICNAFLFFHSPFCYLWQGIVSAFSWSPLCPWLGPKPKFHLKGANAVLSSPQPQFAKHLD